MFFSTSTFFNTASTTEIQLKIVFRCEYLDILILFCCSLYFMCFLFYIYIIYFALSLCEFGYDCYFLRRSWKWTKTKKETKEKPFLKGGLSKRVFSVFTCRHFFSIFSFLGCVYVTWELIKNLLFVLCVLWKYVSNGEITGIFFVRCTKG